jgi:hypothetical protein
MLTVDPNLRASLDEVRSHPWTNEGYYGMPQSHAPHRPSVVREPDEDILRQMADYGFQPDQVREQLSRANAPDSPARCIYHLLAEKAARGHSSTLASSS